MSPNRLRELFRYDPCAGVFVRRVSKGGVPADSVSGCLNREGYLKIRVDGKTYLSHRLAWLYVYGRWPDGQIDHINGDRSDNRIANLREVNHSENRQNIRRAVVTNKSGLLGANWRKDCSRWQAQIMINGKKKYLGLFDSAKEAHAAYLEAKARLHPFQTIVPRSGDA